MILDYLTIRKILDNTIWHPEIFISQFYDFLRFQQHENERDIGRPASTRCSSSLFQLCHCLEEHFKRYNWIKD